MANTVLERGTDIQQRLREEMHELNPAQQEHLNALHHYWVSQGATEDEAARRVLLPAHLLRVGMSIQLPKPWLRPTEPFTPIRVIGRPVSETLLEDREPH